MTKDQVLAILKGAGGYVSGEEISRALGVSRAAVNAAVQSLRKEGYEILSSTNRGYLIAASPNALSAGELLQFLAPERMQRVVCLPTIDSTNNYLRTRAQEGAPHGMVALADEQTSGRGRLGRSFASPGGVGIYLSLLLRPRGTPMENGNITAPVAVAMCDAIEAVSGARPGIKWVNDLTMNGRKLCGILTEMSVEGETGRVQHLITGIGVNVREWEEDFPPEIRHIATSLAMETGKEISRARLAAEMIRRLDELAAGWPENRDSFLAPYRRDCVTLGREIRFTLNGREMTGVAEDIDADFGLVTRLPDGGSVALKTGEVSVRGLYGYV